MSEAKQGAQLIALHEAHVKAWNELDTQALAEIYDPDCLIFDSLPPASINGWKKFRKVLDRITKEFSSIRLKTSDRVTRVDERIDDRIGFITSRYKIEARRDGEKYRASGRWTEIYEKQGSDWKLVHFHSSVDPKDD